jgi:hypothetical protein
MASGAITTLAFCPCGGVERLTWTRGGGKPGDGIIAEVGRAGRRWLDVADMVFDPVASDVSTAATRAHRILSDLPGCAVVTVATDAGCVASWRFPGWCADIEVVGAPAVAAALAYSQLVMGEPVAGSWTVCVTRSGVTRRLVLRTVPLLR